MPRRHRFGQSHRQSPGADPALSLCRWTPPNLVVNSELLREGYHGFSFFSVTPIGLVVLVLGILYMLVMRFMLKGDTQTPQREGWTRRTFRDLIREYRLTLPASPVKSAE